jgi:hypothetical protein
MQLSKLGWVAGAAAILTIAGCGSSAGPPTTGAPTAQHVDLAAQAIQYSRCMRDHGVTNFPDPTVTRESGGGQSLELIVSGALASSPKFKAAQTACQRLMPGPNPADIASHQRQEKAGKLSFAQCMRRRGVTSFPDPDAQGQLTLAMVNAAGVDIHARAVLNAAMGCVPASQGTINKADIQRAEAGG